MINIVGMGNVFRVRISKRGKIMSIKERKKQQIESAILDIELQLRNRETFGKVTAVEEACGLISFKGYLTIIPSYVFTGIDVTEDDLDDPKAVADEFVTNWCNNDDQNSIRMFQQFITDGENWGWD
jgi:hypothetical protein